MLVFLITKNRKESMSVGVNLRVNLLLLSHFPNNYSYNPNPNPTPPMPLVRRRRRRGRIVVAASFPLGGGRGGVGVIVRSDSSSSTATAINGNNPAAELEAQQHEEEDPRAEEEAAAAAAAAYSFLMQEQQGRGVERGDIIIVRRDNEEEEEDEHVKKKKKTKPALLPALPSGLRNELLPKHVAIIMDGNSRWAASRGLPTSAGHQAGYTSLKNIIALSCNWGIRALTVFAFSDDNWGRPQAEIDFLMMLFQNVLKENLRDLLREGIRVCIIGDLSKLPKSLQKLAKEVEENTRNNSRLDLVVAISYSGRSDIVQACQRIAEKVKQGLLEPAEVTESLIAQELETNCVGRFNYPDLLIRTSGELRLSNFLLWQSAYTELCFSEVHWPDFGEADYIDALSTFQRRQRRFGRRTV